MIHGKPSTVKEDFVLLRQITRTRIQLISDQQLHVLTRDILERQNGWLHYSDAYLVAHTIDMYMALRGCPVADPQHAEELNELGALLLQGLQEMGMDDMEKWCHWRALKASFRKIKVNESMEGCIVEWWSLPTSLSWPVTCTFQDGKTGERSVWLLYEKDIMDIDIHDEVPSVRLEPKAQSWE
jgi:hypothetical protein